MQVAKNSLAVICSRVGVYSVFLSSDVFVWSDCERPSEFGDCEARRGQIGEGQIGRLRGCICGHPSAGA